jgi:hypothetical protein
MKVFDEAVSFWSTVFDKIKGIDNFMIASTEHPQKERLKARLPIAKRIGGFLFAW